MPVEPTGATEKFSHPSIADLSTGKQHLADVPERLVYQSEGILKGMLAPPRYLATVLIADSRVSYPASGGVHYKLC